MLYIRILQGINVLPLPQVTEFTYQVKSLTSIGTTYWWA